MSDKRNIPSLDGLRAISIILVIISHLGINIVPLLPRRGLPIIVLSLLSMGHLGVMVFFVISGFLITSLLLREEPIKLSRFYFRRFLRLFPTYYVFLSLILLLSLTGYLQVSRGNLIAAFTYTGNYFIKPAIGYWYVAHTWSLAVEEQFYLIWPVTLLLLGRRRGIWAIGFVVLACPLIRLAYKIHDPSLPTEFFTFETVADSLASGCLLATIGAWLHQKTWYRKMLGSNTPAIVSVAAILLIHWLGKFPILLPSLIFVGLAITLLNFCIAFSIDWCMTNPQSGAGRLLNSRPLVFIGIISYSIYLWHFPFLDPEARWPLFVRLLFVPLAAVGSYYLVERPSLRFRHYLENRRQRPTPIVAGDTWTRAPEGNALLATDDR